MLNPNALEIQIPADHYNQHHYAPSPQDYYADSPAFSTSPSSAAESPYCPVYGPADLHYSDEDPRSPWAEPGAYDPYWSASFAHEHPNVSRPPMMTQCPELPLHAPAPIPGQSSALLSSCAESYPSDPARNPPSVDQFHFSVKDRPPQLAPQYGSQKPAHNPEYGSSLGHAQPTFPTPSEMLNDLAGRPSVLPPPSTVGTGAPDSKTETARKARRRAMAENIGFMPTDPDTISSHEKKRNYLECLEYYVLYLHEQLELVRSRPAAMQRVSNPGRGMSSRSIRTVLVHMESVNRRLNQQILTEEQQFVQLQASISQQTGLRQQNHLQQMQFNNAQP